MHRGHLLLTLLLGFVFIAVPFQASTAEGPLFSPDLAFHFVCGGVDRSSLERRFEGFLRDSGFRLVNKAQVQHQHEIYFFDSDIIGLDDQQRIVHLISVPQTPNRYSVTLETPPPTRRSASLEERILNFVSGGLGCEVRQITRGENRSDAIRYYDEKLRQIDNLFRELEAIQGKRRS